MNVMKGLLTVYILSACTDSDKGVIESEVITPVVNEEPTLTILNPTDGGVFFADELLNISLQVTDAEDAAFDLGLSIQSDIDAELSTEWQVDEWLAGLCTTDQGFMNSLSQ